MPLINFYAQSFLRPQSARSIFFEILVYILEKGQRETKHGFRAVPYLVDYFYRPYTISKKASLQNVSWWIKQKKGTSEFEKNFNADSIKLSSKLQRHCLVHCVPPAVDQGMKLCWCFIPFIWTFRTEGPFSILHCKAKTWSGFFDKYFNP